MASFGARFRAAAQQTDEDLRQHEVAAVGEYDRVHGEFLQGNADRSEVDDAHRQVAYWARVRRARGQEPMSFNTGRLTRTAAARAQALAGPHGLAGRNYYHDLRNAQDALVPGVCAELEADIAARPLLWPPFPDERARVLRPPWARATRWPHIYDAEGPFPRFRLDDIYTCFTAYERSVVFGMPDCLLRYAVQLGDGPHHFVINGVDQAYVMEALTLLTLSTQEDLRSLFPAQNEFSVMFRTIGDLWNLNTPANGTAIYAENVVVSMPPVDMAAYFRAIRDPRRRLTRSEDDLRAYLLNAGAFEALFDSVQSLAERVADAEKGTSMNGYLIRGFDMLVVPIQPRGGAGKCYARTQHHHSGPDAMVLMDRAATRQNCFFAHALPLIGVKYTIHSAAAERAELDISPETPVTLLQATRWAEHRRVNLEIRNINREILAAHYPPDQADGAQRRPYLHLLLETDADGDGHYQRIHQLFKQTTKCQVCGNHMIWDEMHACDAVRANFYEREIRENNVAIKRKVKPATLNYRDVMGFDLEAHPDPTTRRLECYAVGFGTADDPETPLRFYGPDCMERFMDLLLIARPRYLIAFNGRAFDFSYVLEHANARKWRVSRLVVDGYRIMTGVIHLPGGEGTDTITLWDLINFAPGTLRKVAKSYGVRAAKGVFPHKFMSWRTLHYIGPWPEDPLQFFFDRDLPEAVDWLASPEKPEIFDVEKLCCEYLDNDVRCLLQVFVKLNDVDRARYNTDAVNFITGPQEAYTIALAAIPAGVELHIPVHRVEARALRAAYFGGFSQVFQLEADFRHLPPGRGGRIYDANWLYPSILVSYKMPYGSTRWMTAEELAELPRDGRRFVLDCEYVPPKDLFIPILPYRSPDGLLRYTCEPMRGWHPCVKVFLALQLGYTVRPIRGFIWDKSGYFLQPPIQKMIDNRAWAREKVNAQGEPDPAGKPRNPAMAEGEKTKSNAVYGKTAQKPKAKSTIVCRSVPQLTQFMEKNDWTDYVYAGPDAIFITGKRKLNPNDSGEGKPLGIAIYTTALAQCHLIRAMMAIEPTLRRPGMVFMCDTDSIHTDEAGAAAMEAATFERPFVREDGTDGVETVPLIGDGTLQFSDDVKKNYKGDEKIDKAVIKREICLRPKLYESEFEYVLEDGTVKTGIKIKSKGIPEYLWRRDPKRAAEMNPDFFYEAILRARMINGQRADGLPGPPEFVARPFAFDTLKNTGLNPTDRAFSIRQGTITRQVRDGWTGRDLNPNDLIFYPIGYEAPVQE